MIVCRTRDANRRGNKGNYHIETKKWAFYDSLPPPERQPKGKCGTGYEKRKKETKAKNVSYRPYKNH